MQNAGGLQQEAHCGWQARCQRLKPGPQMPGRMLVLQAWATQRLQLIHPLGMTVHSPSAWPSSIALFATAYANRAHGVLVILHGACRQLPTSSSVVCAQGRAHEKPGGCRARLEQGWVITSGMDARLCDLEQGGTPLPVYDHHARRHVHSMGIDGQQQVQVPSGLVSCSAPLHLQPERHQR